MKDHDHSLDAAPGPPSPARPDAGADRFTEPAVSRGRAWLLLGTLMLGYIGIYICRKNFSVANPMIRSAFGATKEQIGIIASYSTLAYMVGKFLFGPVIDRFGGRICFLLALVGVALFTAAGAGATSIATLTLCYSATRLAGAAGWGSMVKLVPGWFTRRSLPLAMSFLSLSFVFGGVCATLLAGWIANRSGGNWRWVMGGPAIALTGILVLCWAVLPRDAASGVAVAGRTNPRPEFQWAQVARLLMIRQFWVICALSFTLTLLRETFNTWTVDFFRTEAPTTMSNGMAAFLSTPFDALGAAGIILLGWAFGRLTSTGRTRLLFGILLTLAAIIFALPSLARQSVFLAAFAVGGVGFLAYGPYSLLAGIFSVEIRGPDYVATVAGLVDGSGYLAAILAGQQFGRILDYGGYRLGFPCLAVLAVIAAVLCLFLYPRQPARPSGVRA